MKLANKIFRPPSLHDDVRRHVFLKNLLKSHIYKLNQTQNVNTCEYVAEVLKEKGFLFKCGIFEKLVEFGPVVLEQLGYAVSDASARIFQISLVLIFLASRDLVRCTTIRLEIEEKKANFLTSKLKFFKLYFFHEFEIRTFIYDKI